MTYSPWGSIDRTEHLGPGVSSVSTPRHGGIRVSEETARAKLSRHALAKGIHERGFYWFEEDCDWAIVAWELEDLRPQFFAHCSTPPEDWESDLRATITSWNLAYALAVGIVTVDALPERYYCTSRTPCDREGLIWEPGTRETPGRVVCKCGHVIYTAGS